jgi:non-specific serine/threonine protein kinase
MGLVALREHDLFRACTLSHEALDVMASVGGPWSVSMLLASIAYIAAASGKPARAAHLGAAAARLAETHHTPMIPLFEPFLAEALARARQTLGEAAYAAATAEGRAMSIDAAVAEALAVEVTPWEAERDAHQFAGLTDAEIQVLQLLTTGRTTREIATDLVVAVSTVDRHLTHIYQKLGVRNRAEAITVALQRRLVSSSPGSQPSPMRETPQHPRTRSP